MVDFMRTDELLAERGSRYGNYMKQTEISNALMSVINAALAERNKTLATDQADALSMICVKVSRIINGDPDYSDNWRDVAGYSTLVADRLEGK